jgi:hypothetical protein
VWTVVGGGSVMAGAAQSQPSKAKGVADGAEQLPNFGQPHS